MQELIDRAAHWLAEAHKAIVFSGAGVSTESGIPDFRSAGGLWTRYNPAEYGTLGAFMRDPQKVWGMLAEMEQVMNVKPNLGHVALAQLERAGYLAGIVTQNIDGLHQAAGNENVVEYHGSNRTYSCLSCRVRFPRDEVKQMSVPPRCPRLVEGHRCDTILKPDVVFFDEAIPMHAVLGADQLVRGADFVLVVGTSCEVYPAAEIPQQVRRQGGRVVEVNMELARGLNSHLSLQGKFSQIVPAIAGRVLALSA